MWNFKKNIWHLLFYMKLLTHRHITCLLIFFYCFSDAFRSYLSSVGKIKRRAEGVYWVHPSDSGSRKIIKIIYCLGLHENWGILTGFSLPNDYWYILYYVYKKMLILKKIVAITSNFYYWGWELIFIHVSKLNFFLMMSKCHQCLYNQFLIDVIVSDLHS